MALRTLVAKKKLGEAQKELEELRSFMAKFEKRESEIAESIETAETEEEKEAVESAIEKLETDQKTAAEKKEELEKEIAKLEKEIADLEEKQEAKAEQKEEEEKRARGEIRKMNTRKFYSMTMEQRDAFFADEEVKSFLERTKQMMMNKRSLSGGEMMIPTVVLPLIKENILKYSKLYERVNVQYVAGQGRQPVMGAIPEAVWTEMCANLNEINITLNGVEVDGYKVGAYIAVCNALLEDSDQALAEAIIENLAAGIGLALDKAMLYGTGTKMPLGIVTRLVQTADPESTNTTIPWVDLHTSNVLSITGKTDLQLIKAIVEASGAANGKYSRGEKFWAMNDKTYTALIAAELSVNSSGAIVAGDSGRMPGVGGDIVVLGFIPDDVIIGGYGDLYLLAERAGTKLAQSTEVMFVEDQTVFKGTARYDGLPVIADAFVAIGINGNTPKATDVTFATDSAN